MKPFTNFHGSVGLKEPLVGSRQVTTFMSEATSAETTPTFTLTFAFGTSMREINDAVIKTVLQFARSNRLQAAELLKINPRTIRRRLGRKSGAGAAQAA
jgi:DNA-binding protein Fis